MKKPGSGSGYTRGIRTDAELATAQESDEESRGMILPGGEGGGDNNIYKNGTGLFTASEWANIPYTGIHNDGLNKGWDFFTMEDGTEPAEGETNGFVKTVPGESHENMSYSIECEIW